MTRQDKDRTRTGQRAELGRAQDRPDKTRDRTEDRTEDKTVDRT